MIYDIYSIYNIYNIYIYIYIYCPLTPRPLPQVIPPTRDVAERAAGVDGSVRTAAALIAALAGATLR